MRSAYVLVKYGQAGGKNLFEVLFQKSIPEIDYNMNRIIIECLVYDSEVESDYQFLAEQRSKTKGGDSRFMIVGKKGPHEIKYESWLEYKHPEYVNAEVTLLSSKEVESLGKSSDYYRSIS